MSNTIKETVQSLYCQTVDAKHRSIDWSETLGEDLEGWEAFSVEECDECGRDVLCSSHMGEDEHRYIEPEYEDDEGETVEVECMSHLYFEGPAMNFFYPCPLDDHEEAARAIQHLPLCVVVLEDGETGFALTGGGMDLSWEICAAYIACGYLPPLDYCGLPDMAGRHRYKDTALILAACQRSCEVAAGWAESKGRSLAAMAEAYSNKTDAA